MLRSLNVVCTYVSLSTPIFSSSSAFYEELDEKVKNGGSLANFKEEKNRPEADLDVI